MVKIEKIQGYNYFKNEKIQGNEATTTTAVGKFAYRREDGIYVVAIGYLKDWEYRVFLLSLLLYPLPVFQYK